MKVSKCVLTAVTSVSKPPRSPGAGKTQLCVSHVKILSELLQEIKARVRACESMLLCVHIFIYSGVDMSVCPRCVWLGQKGARVCCTNHVDVLAMLETMILFWIAKPNQKKLIRRGERKRSATAAESKHPRFHTHNLLTHTRDVPTGQ